jgi:hypothetical protein
MCKKVRVVHDIAGFFNRFSSGLLGRAGVFNRSAIFQHQNTIGDTVEIVRHAA